jgi:iron complex outermembrane receptor protein
MLATGTVGAVDTTGAEYIDLSLEELMRVVVTTASRKSQALGQTAAAAYVISAEDIRRSGATNVPEALRLAPGVQVAAISHNKWSVSIRGFPGRYSNKLLVLVDGRSIYSPLFSGVFWEFHDIPLENIERIEVIRGPGSAVWGANAVNGVINIITRAARGTDDARAVAMLGDELAYGYARNTWDLGDASALRVHVQTRHGEASKVLDSDQDGHDDWRAAQAGFRYDKTGTQGVISLQGGLYDSRAGDQVVAYDFAGTLPPRVRTSGNVGSGGYVLARWERNEASGSRQSVQGYLDHNNLDYSGLAKEVRTTADIEYQGQSTLGKRHDLNWGLGFRVSRDRQTDTEHVRFDPRERTAALWSAYVQDEIALVPGDFSLTLGSRFEYNDYSGFEVQPNMRVLWTPSPRDSLWGALSRGVRTPSRGESDSRAVLSPPSPLIVVSVGDPDIDAESMVALDLGWRRQWHTGLSTDIAAFAYRYKDLRGSIMNAPTPPYLPITLTNASSAAIDGFEAAVDWRVASKWRLKASYAWIDIDERVEADGMGGLSELVDTTPTRQVTVHSTYDLTPGLQCDFVLRHVGKLRLSTLAGPLPVDAYTTLDLRLGWRPAKNLEVSLIGRNLLDDRHLEFIDSHIASTPAEVQRGIHLRAEWSF